MRQIKFELGHVEIKVMKAFANGPVKAALSIVPRNGGGADMRLALVETSAGGRAIAKDCAFDPFEAGKLKDLALGLTRVVALESADGDVIIFRTIGSPGGAAPATWTEIVFPGAFIALRDEKHAEFTSAILDEASP